MADIIVKDLKISFGKKNVFDGFSYVFRDNTIHAIVGESGCGKTTLLRTIAGLLKPNRGGVWLGEQKMIRPTRNVCMMHQKHTNFPWLNVTQNILYPVKTLRKITNQDRTKAAELIKTVKLEEAAGCYPDELSGGMNQRLALARALIQRPQVMLMDEPLSALDPATRTDMQNLLLSFQKETKCLIIMITHSLSEAKMLAGEDILMIEKGEKT